MFESVSFGPVLNDDSKGTMGAEQREAERTQQVLGFAIGLGLPTENRSPAEVEALLAMTLAQRGAPFL